jgi:hypothetical protein
MLGLFDFLFGCYHKNFSFPITKKRGQRLSPAASLTGTYVVCLDCGKEFAYDWQEMKIVNAPAGEFQPLPAKATQYASK